MCSCVFTLAMGIACYLIGFFLGRVTRKFSKKKDDASDGIEIFSIPPDETFLVDVKTGEYSFRSDLIKKTWPQWSIPYAGLRRIGTRRQVAGNEKKERMQDIRRCGEKGGMK